MVVPFLLTTAETLFDFLQTLFRLFVFTLCGYIVELDGLDGEFVGVFGGFEIQPGSASGDLGGAFDRLVQIELRFFEIEFHSA